MPAATGTSIDRAHLIPGFEDDAPWRTAGVLDRVDAKRLVIQLSDVGIDHAVTHDGDRFRVCVRADDLKQALLLRDELELHAEPPVKLQENYHSYLRLLVTIPFGAFLGTVVCYVFGRTMPLIPASTCIALAVFVEAIARGREYRRQHQPQHIVR